MRMDEINGSWISARLTGRRGEKSRLAEAMGIPLNNLSKILSGDRKVQAEEIPAILRFFSETTDHPISGNEVLVGLYSALTDQRKQEALRYLEFLRSQQ